MASATKRAPLHHVEVAVAFERPHCVLIGGWASLPDDFVELEVVSTLSGFEATSLMCCGWHSRVDLEGQLDKHVPKPGFCGLAEILPEQLDGPLYLSFRLADGRRLLGGAIEPVPVHPKMRHDLERLFTLHRGLVPPRLMLQTPRPMELLRLVAATPLDFTESAAMWVEHAVPLPDGSTWISGWCYAEHGFEWLEVLDEHGHTLADVLQSAVFFPRHDVAQFVQGYANADGLGFTLNMRPHARDGKPWRLCAATKDGKFYGIDVQVSAPETVARTVERIVSAVQPSIPRENDLIDRCLGPALFSLNSHVNRSELAFAQRSYGASAEDVDVAIVVSAHDADFLRYQLATFEGNRELESCNLVYVVSDPEAEAKFVRTADDIHRHFGVGFRLLVASERVSKPVAVNAAIRILREQYILLMDSRVLPRGSFVFALRNAYASAGDACGAGPKLVNEDGTIEHGPMPSVTWDHARLTDEGIEQGLPEGFLEFEGPIRVASLSSACLFIERERLMAAGGLAEGYCRVRSADLDLSERLMRGGKHLYFVPEAILDCLRSDAQSSFSAVLEQRLNHYDRWLLGCRRARAETYGS